MILYGIGVVVYFVILMYLVGDDPEIIVTIVVGIVSSLSWAGVGAYICVWSWKRLKLIFFILILATTSQAQRFDEYDSVRRKSINLHLEDQKIIKRNALVFICSGLVLGHFVAKNASHDGSVHKPTQAIITASLISAGAMYTTLFFINKRRRKPWSL